MTISSSFEEVWETDNLRNWDSTVLPLGPSHVTQEEQAPLLHRDVQRLEDWCIKHISHRLPGHQHPIASLGMLPHELCDKILTHLMKNKTLAPKAMQAFISW